MKHLKASYKKQQGVAAIMTMVLVGLSLTATIMSTSSYLRSSQEKHTVLHAQTVAQARAWTAAEALRLYLDGVAKDNAWDELISRLTDLPETISMDLNGIEATVTALDNSLAVPRLTARIVAKAAQGSRAESSSILEVVYAVSPTKAGASSQNVLTFNRNLTLGGSITVETEPGEPYQLNVKGNLDTNGNSIEGISVIRATESIQIGSGSDFDELHANGDIKLSGSVSGQKNIKARGNICLSGGASAMGLVKANGSVIGSGGASFGDISSIGLGEGIGPELCTQLAEDESGKPYGVDLRNNASAKSIKSKASVRVNSGSVDALQSEGDLDVTNWGGDVSGQIGGEVRSKDPNLPDAIDIQPGLVVPISPVVPVSENTAEFNAYDLREDANYAFWVDSSGYIIVTVKNVNGAENRDYYLGSYSKGPYKDRLCSSLTSGSTPKKPICKTPIKTQSVPICKGYSDWNNCFSYNSKKQAWTINGVSAAQGILWFEGDLNLGNGSYYSTFIATGDIETNGSHQTTAPNYAGYAKGNSLDHGMCSNLVLADHYPTQLCVSGNYNYDFAGGLGNFALLAGSCNPASVFTCDYQGGNIETGSSSTIRGAIKAGNNFASGGSSTVYGYISALALGEPSKNASMGGSTNIILKDLPEGYDPAGGATVDSGDGSETPSANASATLLWSHYL